MKPAIYLGVALLLLPFVLSFDCSLVDDNSFCQQIASLNISDEEKELVYSSLVYPETKNPNHKKIQKYNQDIYVNSPPDYTPVYSSNYIKNAWVSFLSISPSVYEDGLLYVPYQTKALSEYDYDVQIPNNYYASKYPYTSQGDCKRKNYLKKNKATLQYQFKNNFYQSGKSAYININSDGTIISKLKILTTVKIKHYKWKKVWGWWKWKYAYKCKYHHTNYNNDNEIIQESKDVKLYNKQPLTDIEVLATYKDTTKINVTTQDSSYTTITFPESSFKQQRYRYNVVFEKKPYHVAYLVATPSTSTSIDNLYADGNTVYVKNVESCEIETYNHFFKLKKSCVVEEKSEVIGPLEIEKKDIDLSVGLYVALFLLLCYLLYAIAKSKFRKFLMLPLFLILLIPSAVADTDECGLTNLGSCIVDYFIDTAFTMINAPLVPLLWLTETLLTADVDVSIFYHIWSVVRYMIGFFYIFFILYAGYTLLTSSAIPAKREHAKEVLKSLVMMIILIQGSFYLYELLIGISASMSSVIIGMIDPTFFQLTADNIVNFGLQILLVGVYLLVLLLTVLLLLLRYIIVALGVILFPIALFCYFVPPLKTQGKFLFTLLGTMIFLPFFNLIVIYGCSQLLNIPIFQNFKILVMIGCFALVILSTVFAVKFAIGKALAGKMQGGIIQVVRFFVGGA